jgi:DNA mismatch endonuclease (patch repair protein)
MDTLTPERRSWNMSRIGGRNTGPELAVRRLLRSMGIGYRLHVRTLPGRPDIVMKGRKKIIEVRGCFWHRHSGCSRAYSPKSNTRFWSDKFAATIARDTRNEASLRDRGWDVLVLWECEAENASVIRRRIESFLGFVKRRRRI